MSSYILDRSKILGGGRYGTVFAGILNGTNVAVKRVQRLDVEDPGKFLEREKIALEQCAHPNIVKLLHIEDDADFWYFVLELAQASLDYCFLPETEVKKYRGPLPPERDRLLQLARGLEHIHSLDFIHRDCKPQNVLIFDTGDGPVLKWADFGLVKKSNHRGSASMSGVRGTRGWKAPELLSTEDETTNSNMQQRVSKKSDIFTAGCVFFYSLSGGLHPFGEKWSIEKNILKGKPVHLSKISSHFAQEIIEKMIQHDPANRADLAKVIEILEAT